MTGGCWKNCRGASFGWIAGRRRRLDRGFAHFEAWRDEVLEQEERDFHKLGRQIAREEDWLRYGVTAQAQAQCEAGGGSCKFAAAQAGA